jgi:subtilisin family serine protease
MTKWQCTSPRRYRSAQSVLHLEALESRAMLNGAGLGDSPAFVGPLLPASAAQTTPAKTIHIDGSLAPNDPSFGVQWDLSNTGQGGGTPGADIHALNAWGTTTGTGQTTVAVIDTGIDYDHPDLFENIWINQAEIPASRMQNLIDVDGDGIIDFRDLNDSRNQGPGKITDVNHDGRIDAADILAPMQLDASGNDTGLGGWAHNSTQDGETQHPDDLIGWNFVNNTNNPFDDNGHGTHVSGTIGAMGNNSVGIAGIDWTAHLMALKFLDSSGSGNDTDAASAIAYAIRHGAKIANNSWGGRGDDPTVDAAVADAHSAGLIFVAAAGNGGANNDLAPSYPANVRLDNVVSVAATDNRDQLAPFSNYGAATVDIAAPGVNIFSTYPNGTYRYMSGTSMAAPHVTGVLALVWDQHPDWTYREVIDQLLRTADRLPGLAGKTVTGGRLDAAAAVNAPNADIAYVQQLYHDLLGRTADIAGMDAWVSALEASLPRAQVAQAIWMSAEHRGREVDTYYATYLRHAADPAGRAGWVNAFLAGATETDVIQAFVTSPEYRAEHAGSATYLSALYQDLLGRPADAGGLAGWVAALTHGLSPQQVAHSLLTSAEGWSAFIRATYGAYLHRAPDPSGAAVWLAELGSGHASPGLMAVAILSSEEYHALAAASGSS